MDLRERIAQLLRRRYLHGKENEIADAILALTETREEECPECGGEGAVIKTDSGDTDLYDSWDKEDCPTCHGTGTSSTRKATIEEIIKEWKRGGK